MRRIRTIPTLLLSDRKLVKTVRFKNPGYVGDPVNALRIFNEKEVDEICVLDIHATRNNRQPDLLYIRQLASECFMPLSYGGGVTTSEEANEIYKSGVEKIIFGTSAFTNPDLITKVARMAGAQSVVVSVDFKNDWLNRNSKVFVRNGTENTKLTPVAYAKKMQELGAGELFVQNIDREGTGKGYDTDLIKAITQAVTIPVIASGGANSIDDFLLAVRAGASAVAAGAMFVYKGPHKAVLINYPDQETLKQTLYNNL